MRREGEQTLLRIHIRSTDRSGWSMTSSALLKSAFRQKLAGATVLEAIAGLDSAGRLLQPRWWWLVKRVPIIVELTDWPQAIGSFLESARKIVVEGLATLERAHVLIYRHERSEASPRPIEVPSAPGTFSSLPTSEEFPIMSQTEEGQLLRIFIDNSDLWQSRPLYRAILGRAQELGLASAAVFRADSGYGAHHRLHSSRGEYVSDQPLIIEIVDRTAKIQTILPFLDGAIGEGLVTIEGVRMLQFNSKKN